MAIGYLILENVKNQVQLAIQPQKHKKDCNIHLFNHRKRRTFFYPEKR